MAGETQLFYSGWDTSRTTKRNVYRIATLEVKTEELESLSLDTNSKYIELSNAIPHLWPDLYEDSQMTEVSDSKDWTELWPKNSFSRKVSNSDHSITEADEHLAIEVWTNLDATRELGFDERGGLALAWHLFRLPNCILAAIPDLACILTEWYSSFACVPGCYRQWSVWRFYRTTSLPLWWAARA
jgi:hypothetical protein